VRKGAVDRAGDPGPENLASTPFDELPPEAAVRAFGVDYAHVKPEGGGDLYVTRYGWPFLAQLLPVNWYENQWYARKGEKLPGATGQVYRVPTRPVAGKSLDIVVKFSRVAQDVLLELATTVPEDLPPEILANARFNSPIEEFGLLMELRRGHGRFGPGRIRTQRPLAIYAPPEEYEAWQLGRNRCCFHSHRLRSIEDDDAPAKAIELDIKRLYVLLYSWIDGQNAQETLMAGDLSYEEFVRLTPRVTGELWAAGFYVLDSKPTHLILRNRKRNGALMRRDDDSVVYGLVDYELLQRTPEHRRRFKTGRRRRYWQLQNRRLATEPKFPSHLARTTIFGVDYVFGATPDGGKIWVVGREPELFDYFLPERWRRSPRVRLSLTNQVYYTRTRDNIHLVYRRSRVGAQPRVDPLFEQGRRIREHGFNSPFEEVAVAERLRQMGIPTTRPRAVFRTGHRSTRTIFRRDQRRFEDHAGLMTAEARPEPILGPDHDYYTLWGYYRGIDSDGGMCANGRNGVIDLEQAYEEGIIGKEACANTTQDAHRRLHALGFDDTRVDEHEFVVTFDNEGGLRRDEAGEIDVVLSVDALTAYEHGLIDDERYRNLIERLLRRLRTADCEKLNLAGNHLLLSMNPDGVFRVDRHEETEVVLCNFEFIRGLYRPIR